MDKVLEKIMKFSIGSLGYSLLEIIWRGYTHWSMMITGGLLFCTLGDMFKSIAKKNIIYKCLSGAAAITITEFIVGIVSNLIFKMNVWDYSKEKLNVLGQICLKYFCLWSVLSIFIMIGSKAVEKGVKMMLIKR